VLPGVERERLGDRERLVGDGVELGVAVTGIQRQDSGAGLARVVDPLEEGDRGPVLGDDEEGLASSRGLEAGQADRLRRAAIRTGKDGRSGMRVLR